MIDQKMRPRHDRYSWQGQPTHVVRYVYPLKKRAHFVYNSATISYLDIATSQQETNGHCKSSAARLGSASQAAAAISTDTARRNVANDVLLHKYIAYITSN